MLGTIRLFVSSVALEALVLTPHSSAQPNVVTLFSGNSLDQIYGGLVLGSNGAIYGPTEYGGMYERGSVFELLPPGYPGAAWTLSFLHSFQGPDGASPQTKLVLGKTGALYGTAVTGGSYKHGVAFELMPPAAPGGTWTERVLHSFSGQNGDGGEPQTLAAGVTGELYGTTYSGGTFGLGTVFKLTPPSSAGSGWAEAVLYSFGSEPGDGYPGALLVGKDGSLYGTTGGNEASNYGAVFRLTPPAAPGGAWTETVLYNFAPEQSTGAQLAVDSSGDLYGTSPVGGNVGCGSVFQLKPPLAAGGNWTFVELYSFTGQNGDGVFPNGGVIIAKDGTLYGTTAYGGGTSDQGTVFWLTPPAVAGGVWTETVIPPGAENANPFARLLFGEGVIYGAGNTSVFELTAR